MHQSLLRCPGQEHAHHSRRRVRPGGARIKSCAPALPHPFAEASDCYLIGQGDRGGLRCAPLAEGAAPSPASAWPWAVTQAGVGGGETAPAQSRAPEEPPPHDGEGWRCAPGGEVGVHGASETNTGRRERSTRDIRAATRRDSHFLLWGRKVTRTSQLPWVLSFRSHLLPPRPITL